MQYNIANLPALMLRETSMLGVSAMMLHHLSVTFKIYLMFVWCASCAAPCAAYRGEHQWSLPRRGGWGSKFVSARSRMVAHQITCEFDRYIPFDILMAAEELIEDRSLPRPLLCPICKSAVHEFDRARGATGPVGECRDKGV